MVVLVKEQVSATPDAERLHNFVLDSSLPKLLKVKFTHIKHLKVNVPKNWPANLYFCLLCLTIYGKRLCKIQCFEQINLVSMFLNI
jgi:hypothetical protein